MGTASLSYDASSGFYASAFAVGALEEGSDHPVLLGAIGNVGYAKRLSPGLSIDGGVVDSEYPNRLGGYGATRYTELYLGLLTHNLSTRLYYSPNYYTPGQHTLYGEVDGSIRLPAEFHLNGHIGLLGYLRTPEGRTSRGTQYDWRIGLSRQLGPFDLHAAVSGGGPGDDYYDRIYHSRTALTAGIGWRF